MGASTTTASIRAERREAQVVPIDAGKRTKARRPVPGAAGVPEIIFARIVAMQDGQPLVDWPANPGKHPLAALATASLDLTAVGREAALLFVDGDPARPLIVGLIAQPAAEGGERTDGGRLRLTAEREITLACGEASITLTKAGKLLLKGAYVSSRSSGVNRIRGGTVEIN